MPVPTAPLATTLFPPLASALRDRLAFALELDRLKGVERRTWRLDRSRRENSAEHSWHLATMALVFAEHAPDGSDVDRVVRMLLVHDLVEIDAGDTFAFDAVGLADRGARERLAADRLFGLLPDGLALRALWEEFDAADTPDARYANAIDRLAPLLLNLHTDGGTWREHGVTRAAVLARMRPIETGLPALWAAVVAAIDAAVDRGWVRPDAPASPVAPG
jgi:putative hydrolase of HD superfamily